MKTYLIPGLGGDHRMYAAQLAKFPNTISVDYKIPNRGETLHSYAKRMLEEIDTDEPFQLLGVSFGGMVSLEIAKIIRPTRIILISSVKNRKELPSWIKFFKYFPLQKIIPGKIYLWAFLILIRFKRLAQDGNMISARLRAMAEDANGRFVYWAVNQVINWENIEYPSNTVHIHGDSDVLFPINKLSVDYTIKNGSHAMILTHSKSINDVLDNYL